MGKKTVNDSYLITFSEFKEFMFHNIVPLEEINDFKGVPILKILPFWRKNELIPYIQKGKHIKISFAELIWLRILDTLRQFSYPLQQTVKVCHYFFKDAYDNDLPKRNMEHNKKMLIRKKQAGTLTEEESSTLEYLESFLNDKVLLHILKTDINYLTCLVTECISNGEERGILIFHDGRVAESNGQGLLTHADYEVDMLEPHIYLSITHYLKEFIESEQLATIFLPQVLNDDERKVLKELKNRNAKQITITFADGRIEKISSTKEGIVTGQQAKKIKEILGLRNYQQITLDTLNESTLKIKRTNKKI